MLRRQSSALQLDDRERVEQQEKSRADNRLLPYKYCNHCSLVYLCEGQHLSVNLHCYSVTHRHTLDKTCVEKAVKCIAA